MQNINDLMKEAQKMQKRMEEAQQQLTQLIVEGKAGGDLVIVKMDGSHSVKSVTLSPSLEEDFSMIPDLVAAAVNDAVRKIEKASKEKINELAAGFNLPADLKDKE